MCLLHHLLEHSETSVSELLQQRQVCSQAHTYSSNFEVKRPMVTANATQLRRTEFKTSCSNCYHLLLNTTNQAYLLLYLRRSLLRPTDKIF